MFKRKCSGCGKKIEKKFSYCPYCGISFKVRKNEENFGFLGKDDFMPELEKELNQGFKMPFGLDKIMKGLIRQLEKEMSKNLDSNQAPKGFKIQISTGNPQMQRINLPTKRIIRKPLIVSEEELERRKSLPKQEAESSVRRLSDKIVYEIKVPGVRSGEDVMLTKLEDSIEIKAYSKNKCFFKIIPLKVEVMGYYIKDNKLFVELKD